MSHAVQDDALQSEFVDFLKYIDDPLCDQGEVSLPGIIIPQLSKHDSLSFPLSQSIISKIESISKPSPFGQDTTTKVDDKVRKGFELETKQFHFENP